MEIIELGFEADSPKRRAAVLRRPLLRFEHSAQEAKPKGC